MNRRWQKDGVGRYETLPSLGWFTSQLPPLKGNLSDIASITDVYSVFSALHAKGRNPRPAANMELGFYYLTADMPVTPSAATVGAGPEVRRSHVPCMNACRKPHHTADCNQCACHMPHAHDECFLCWHEEYL